METRNCGDSLDTFLSGTFTRRMATRGEEGHFYDPEPSPFSLINRQF